MYIGLWEEYTMKIVLEPSPDNITPGARCSATWPDFAGCISCSPLCRYCGIGQSLVCVGTPDLWPSCQQPPWASPAVPFFLQPLFESRRFLQNIVIAWKQVFQFSDSHSSNINYFLKIHSILINIYKILGTIASSQLNYQHEHLSDVGGNSRSHRENAPVVRKSRYLALLAVPLYSH